MTNEYNVISVSGGKDSTALLLLAIEREPDNLRAVFADTGTNTVQEAHDAASIDASVAWSQTSHGGKQFDFLRIENEGSAMCSSIYGLCE